jgi:CelD/BcsL family acetyltransferase involved in cellulose biosynthesis
VSSGLDIRVVTEEAGFEALRDRWSTLAGACANRSVFLTHEWFDAAWQWRRLKGALRILCGYRGHELVALLPLVLEASGSPWRRVRQLEFLTVPDTQFCDLIVREQDRDAAAQTFAAALQRRRGEWDVVRLRYLPEDSVASGRLLEALRRQGCVTTMAPAAPNPFVALDDTWDAYYATRSRSLKKANNLAANRLKKAGDISIEWLAPGAGDASAVDRVLSAVTGISQRSWKVETGNSLDSPGPQAFIRRLSRIAHERGWLSVWLLALDGKPLAMEYQLVADGSAYALRADFDAECERLQISPGSHLSRHLLERLFGKGLTRYFMGPGNNAYKYRWTEQAAQTYELTAYSDSFSGRSLATWELKLKPVLRRLRERVRPEKAPVGKTDEVD